MKIHSVQITIGLAIVAVVIAMGGLVYQNQHPRHVYDAQDLVRDTAWCKAHGFGVKPDVHYPFRNTTSDPWVAGASCTDGSGALIFIPDSVRTGRSVGGSIVEASK